MEEKQKKNGATGIILNCVNEKIFTYLKPQENDKWIPQNRICSTINQNKGHKPR